MDKKRGFALTAAAVMVFAACTPAATTAPASQTPASVAPAASASTGTASQPPASAAASAASVKLQLQWAPQAQFAGYFAAQEQGYFEANGLKVTLLWDPRSNEVSVEVIDQLDDSGFRLPIAGHLALDAFYHPYAYAQSPEDHCDRLPQTISAQ